jgi:hypothetical protein
VLDDSPRLSCRETVAVDAVWGRIEGADGFFRFAGMWAQTLDSSGRWTEPAPMQRDRCGDPLIATIAAREAVAVWAQLDRAVSR